ncbi:MAG: hypothetical protein AAGF01_29030, partial [Cyanobacteria bacterium P01_G01_bin.38]
PDETPQPIHPMDAMTAQLNEPMDETLSDEDVDTITVKVIDATEDKTAHDELADAVIEAEAVEATVEIAVDAVEVKNSNFGQTLSSPVVDELNEAIATAHLHERELEAQIEAIQAHENQLQQRVEDAEHNAKQFTQELVAADLRENTLKQEIVELKKVLAEVKDESSRIKTQAMQAQAKLNDQDKNQREIRKLKGEVTTLKEELDEAKRYILQLTEQLTAAQFVPQTPSSPQPTASNQRQASTTFPPPLTQRAPHTQVVASPRSQPRRPAPRPIAPIASKVSTSPSGLPQMPTERFGRSAPISSQRSPSSLRPAYTRPGFPTPQSPPPKSHPGTGPGQPRPMPPLESITQDGNPSRTAQSPSSSNPDNLGSSPSNSGAIIPKKSSSIARRRSRYVRPGIDVNTSDLPQPKVSDAEIGWFD